MWDIKEAKDYFYMETAHAEISEIVLAETKDSYFDSINCFRIVTTEGQVFFIFNGDATLTNI